MYCNACSPEYLVDHFVWRLPIFYSIDYLYVANNFLQHEFYGYNPDTVDISWRSRKWVYRFCKLLLKNNEIKAKLFVYGLSKKHFIQQAKLLEVDEHYMYIEVLLSVRDDSDKINVKENRDEKYNGLWMVTERDHGFMGIEFQMCSILKKHFCLGRFQNGVDYMRKVIVNVLYEILNNKFEFYINRESKQRYMEPKIKTKRIKENYNEYKL